MAIQKTDLVLPFHKVRRGTPFAVTMTLYLESEGKEDPKEHILFKANSADRAKTLNKRYVVYIPPNEKVTICRLEKKPNH